MCLLLFIAAAAGLSARAAVIENTALFTFERGGSTESTTSTTTTVPIKERTPAEIVFKTYDASGSYGASHSVSTTSYRQPDDQFADMGGPLFLGRPISLSSNLVLEEVRFYRSGIPAFIILRDLDQNLDPNRRETVFVTLSVDNTGDVEILRLTEETPNSGTFAGYIQISTTPPGTKNGILSVQDGSKILASYTDAYDSTDLVATAAAVNPLGRIFDSSTGSPINGARIRLANASDGSDATVFDADGITPMSNVMISGTNGVDGTYQFPIVPPGDYLLEVVPPDGYAWSSKKTAAELQVLPNAPFELGGGSFGSAFAVSAISTFLLDIPLDPLTESAFIVKEANRDSVGIGEYLRYTITVSNPNQNDIPNAEIVDVQPFGFRYEKGSSYLADVKIADPTLSSDGRELRWSLGTLAAGETREIQYVARTSVGCREGEAVNTATLQSAAAGISFSATARVFVYDDMRPDATLIGRVAIDPHAADVKHLETPTSGQTNAWDGVPGVRVYMENGAYVVTDKDGLYHFEGVKPGTHVLQIDLETLPAGLEPVAIENTRFAGRAYSQFVEVQEGSLWRADFPVRRMAPPESAIRLKMNTAAGKSGVVELELSGQAAPVGSMTVILVTPDEAAVNTNAVLLDGQSCAVEQIDNMFTFRLKESAADWSHRIELPTELTGEAQTNDYKVMVMYDWGTLRNQRLPLHIHSAAVTAPTKSEFMRTLPKPDLAAAKAADSDSIERFSPAWMEQLKSGFEWIEPVENARPDMPVMNVALKHDPSEKITLYVNKIEVDPIHLEGRMRNAAKTLEVSRWRAVPVQDGWNELEAVRFDEDGKVAGHSIQKIYYAGMPIKAEYVEEGSTLVADGRTVPTILIRLTDINGEPARRGLIGEYSVNSPYEAYSVNRGLDHARTSLKNLRPTYTIGSDGIAELKLEPTAASGEVVLNLRFDEYNDEEINAWLEAPLREWILVGFAEGTAGYNTLHSHMESGPPSVDENYYDNGQVAFFAKGRIKGDFLLTMAYDSAKDTSENSLFQTIDPDTYYTLYGDETKQGYEAASAEKLFLKIEKEAFYALFGDYESGLSVTELGRYSRSMSGFKSEFNGEHFEYTVFAADIAQGFRKDEIPGNGTSGLYQLSSPNLVQNSEKVVIETRDRFHSERVLKTETLSRHLDYNIDYRKGTLYFKKPVSSRDGNFNPNVIVVDYEVDAGGKTALTYGGRVAAKTGERLEVGVTTVQEGQAETTDELYAADTTVKLTDHTELRAEAANSSSTRNPTDGEQTGEAYLLELERETERTTALAYYRRQSENFGLRQQSAGQAGTEKFGVEASGLLVSNLTVNAEAYHQENLMNDALRDVAGADVTYEKDRVELKAGLLHADEEYSDGASGRSDQIVVGSEYELIKEKVDVRAERHQSLGGQNGASTFPTRSVLGADYRFAQKARLFTEYELAEGEQADTQNLRAGVETEPWKGGRVNTSLGQQHNENGPRTYSNLGLFQTVEVTDKWTVEGGVDISQTIYNGQQRKVLSDDASGSTDFWALSLGTGYEEQLWSWTQRAEQLWGAEYDRFSYVSGILGQVRPQLSMSLSSAFYLEDGEKSDELAVDLRHGLAWRPTESDWVVLNRLDYIYEKQSSATMADSSQRIVNQLSANWHPNRKLQASLHYGCKYMFDHLGENYYDTFTDLYGLELRYNITKKWDFGYQLFALHGWNDHEIDYATGPSIGYNPAKNIWISLGYNVAGFYDEDFSASNFTTEGPYLMFRMKFDQDSLNDLNEVLKSFIH